MITYNVTLFTTYHSHMLMLVRLDCVCKRVSRAKNCKLNELILRQPNTYIQESHSSSSIKGKVGSHKIACCLQR